MMVKGAVLSQADNRHVGRRIIVHRDRRILDASPPPLHQEVVQGPSPSIPTDLKACGLHAAGKIAAAKLRALIARPDLWLASLQSPRSGLHATPHSPRDGHRPRPHIPAEPLQHRDHIHTPRTQPARRDVRPPDVIHTPNGPPAQQGRIDAMPRGQPARARLGREGLHPQDPPPPRDTRGIHRLSLGLEPRRQAAHSLQGRPGVRFIPQAPQREGRRALAHGSIVHTGPWHAHEPTLPGQADRGLGRFDPAPLGLRGQVQRCF